MSFRVQVVVCYGLLSTLLPLVAEGALTATHRRLSSNKGADTPPMMKRMMMMKKTAAKSAIDYESKTMMSSKGSSKGSSAKMAKGGMMKQMRPMMKAMTMKSGKGSMPKAELTPMSFQLDWRFNTQFAGVFLADYYGYFADKGVEMEIRPWDNGINAVMDVANGVADFACAEQNNVLAVVWLW